MIHTFYIYLGKEIKNAITFEHMKKCILILFSVFISAGIFAQRNVKDSVIGTPLIGAHYGGNFTLGDLADRYGYLNHIGIMAGYKTERNWYWSFDGNFIFGNQIRLTGIFDHLIDSYGNITDINGDIAQVYVFARGFNANFAIGKVIPILSPNKNSGIMINFGCGYLLHKMKIETQEQVIPQLELNYRKGYDRLTVGPNLHQFIGYTFLSNGGFYNFYGGFYAQEGFTKNQRTIFYDQPSTTVPTTTRLDMQIGFRVGWYIPFYKRMPKDYYID
jgi:hypothetical protein